MLSVKLVFIVHGLLICSYVDEIDNLCVLYDMRQLAFITKCRKRYFL